jgi:hypothetical protein
MGAKPKTKSVPDGVQEGAEGDLRPARVTRPNRRYVEPEWAV